MQKLMEIVFSHSVIFFLIPLQNLLGNGCVNVNAQLGMGLGGGVECCVFAGSRKKKKKAARLEARPLRWNTCHTWFALICVVAVTSRSPSNALVAPADGPLSYRGPCRIIRKWSIPSSKAPLEPL